MRITIDLSDDDYCSFKRICKANRENRSQLIIKWIRDYCGTYDSATVNIHDMQRRLEALEQKLN